jgi:hypothetical protein
MKALSIPEGFFYYYQRIPNMFEHQNHFQFVNSNCFLIRSLLSGI